MITLIDIFEGLGNQAKILLDEKEPIENRRRTAELAVTTSLVAKQMINIADIALRAEKQASDSKLKDSMTMKLLTGGYALVVGDGNGEFVGKR